MRKLYDIDKDIENFEWEFDPDTGELLNEDALEALQMERDAKIEGVALKVKNLTAELEAVKREKSAFAERASALEKDIESYKNYLAYALKGKKFSTGKVAISFRQSKSVLVKNEALIPDKYCEFSTVRKPDKKSIKEALNKGEVVMGAELIEKSNTQIK